MEASIWEAVRRGKVGGNSVEGHQDVESKLVALNWHGNNGLFLLWLVSHTETHKQTWAEPTVRPITRSQSWANKYKLSSYWIKILASWHMQPPRARVGAKQSIRGIGIYLITDRSKLVAIKAKSSWMNSSSETLYPAEAARPSAAAALDVIVWNKLARTS